MNLNHKRITIASDNGTPLWISMRFGYRHRELPQGPVAQGFQVKRTYRYAEGDKAGMLVTDLKAGELVKVELTVYAPKARHYVAVDDLLPAALEIIDSSLSSVRNYGGLEHARAFNHNEKRDDRFVLFSDYMPVGVHRYDYLARATSKGRFTAGPVVAHEMYSPQTMGLSPAQTFTVQ